MGIALPCVAKGLDADEVIAALADEDEFDTGAFGDIEGEIGGGLADGEFADEGAFFADVEDLAGDIAAGGVVGWEDANGAACEGEDGQGDEE